MSVIILLIIIKYLEIQLWIYKLQAIYQITLF